MFGHVKRDFRSRFRVSFRLGEVLLVVARVVVNLGEVVLVVNRDRVRGNVTFVVAPST